MSQLLHVVAAAALLLGAAYALEMESPEADERMLHEMALAEADDNSDYNPKRAPTPNVCTGGSTLLNYQQDYAPCRSEERSDAVWVWRSPKNNIGNCTYKFGTDAPGMMRGIYVRVHLAEGESLKFTHAFGDSYTIKSEDQGGKYVYPTTFGSFEYSSNIERQRPAGFVYVAVPRSNWCNRVITAPAGSTGRIESPGFRMKEYRKNSFCQWWIRAPEGKKITLKFNTFNIGNSTYEEKCQYSDYLGVDKSGDPTYTSDSAYKMCGSDVPEPVVSDANKMNVLFNGKAGGKDDKAFCFTYHVDF